MAIFRIKNNRLSHLAQIPFDLEAKIQSIVEGNLREVFNLELKLVKSEFPMGGREIDTLAYDENNKCFIIIEYKKDRNISVIDQGYTYLSILLENKAEIVLYYNEKFRERAVRLSDVYWSQSRIFFVSPEFTDFQKGAINFSDLPFKCWEVNLFEDNLIIFNQIKAQEGSPSILALSSTSKAVQKVSKEIKVYSEKDFLAKVPDEIVRLYNDLKARIQSIGEVEIAPTSLYIAFKKETNFTDIEPQKKALKLWLNLRVGELDDPKKVARDVSKIGHWGNRDYELKVKSDTDLDYVMFLIKQAYRKQAQ